MLSSRLLLFVAIAAGLFEFCNAEPNRAACFRVRTDVSGIDYRNVCGSKGQWPILEQNGQGIGIIDFDNDGLPDLFVPNGSTEARWRAGENPGCKLYKNLGGWRFVDVTDKAGVRGNAWSSGVAVADYDADGDFDIYVLNWGKNVLYRNDGDGTFTDVTHAAGVGETRWSSSAAFADFNGDGRLDIYVSNYVRFSYDDIPKKEKDGRECLYRDIKTGCGPWCYDGERDTLYINLGDGRFEDRSESFGLACTDGYRGFGVIAADFDGDRDTDVYVGCDVMPNLFLELRDGRFASVGSNKGGAYNADGRYESGMGVAAADFDKSGALDLFTTNFSQETNTFYRNLDGLLSDTTVGIRFDGHRIEMGWGVSAADFNQDGLIDVFVANGHIYPQVEKLNDPTDRYAQTPRFYVQTSTGRLEEIETKRAFSRVLRHSLRGCASADLDNDGDLDLVAVQHNGPLVFFENLSNRPAVTIELIDARGGRSPMGTRIKVPDGGTYWLLPNQGYQSSHDHRIHIPWRDKSTTVQMDVIWPDGTSQPQAVNRPTEGAVQIRKPSTAAPR